MSKTEFIAVEEKYIVSVATTFGIIKESVNVLNIEETSTRDLNMVALRMLLEKSVSVKTSVLLANGRQIKMQDHSILNLNLLKNGLPNGTLVLATSSVNKNEHSTSNLSSVTATPIPYGSGSTPSTSTIPIEIVVGSVVSILLAALCVLLVCRKLKRNSRNRLTMSVNSVLVVVNEVLSCSIDIHTIKAI
jgi:hypothetical protein